MYNRNKTALYFYETNLEFSQDSLLLKAIYGESKLLDVQDGARLGTSIQNELEILNIHNPIRNYNQNSFSFIHVFKDDLIKNHNFRLNKILYTEDIPLYEIEFISNPNTEYMYMGAGKIYISKDKFAIYKLEYKAFKNFNYLSDRFLKNSFASPPENKTYKNNATLFEVNIEYKAIENKMYLNYMTFNNRFIIKEPNPFKIETLSFNPDNESFYITFNRVVDESTIKRKSNFKLRYKNKKLIIKSLELVKPKVVRIKVVSWSAGMSNTTSETKAKDFSYKIKNIKDNLGVEINEESKLLGYQFRELFTQEVFENKEPIKDLIYVIKELPLSSTKVNTINFDIDKYWISAPLKRIGKKESSH